jgi:hypothetical protein
MLNLNEILLRWLGSQQLVELWWASPNKAFDGAIPDDILHSDRRNEVVSYILQHSGSDFS